MADKVNNLSDNIVLGFEEKLIDELSRENDILRKSIDLITSKSIFFLTSTYLLLIFVFDLIFKPETEIGSFTGLMLLFLFISVIYITHTSMSLIINPKAYKNDSLKEKSIRKLRQRIDNNKKSPVYDIKLTYRQLYEFRAQTNQELVSKNEQMSSGIVNTSKGYRVFILITVIIIFLYFCDNLSKNIISI